MHRRRRLAWVRIRRFFDTGNLVRAIAALVLAFALWAWVTAESDPEITRTIPSVSVTAVHVMNDLEVIGQPPTVQIRLEGPQSKVQPLETGSVRAHFDLSNVKTPGSYTLPVEVDTPENVRVKQITPPKVSVTVDRIVPKSGVNVITTPPSNLPANYEVRSITTNPQQVQIKGPQEKVDLVTAVRVDISVDGRSSSYTDVLTPVPVDSSGRPVPDVTVNPSQVTVSVDLEVRGQVRKVIPEVTGTDALAPGYELVRPPTAVPTDEVIVDGPKDEVAKVLYVTTEPIDITGWSESKNVPNVNIDLSQIPADVTVDPKTVTVSIQIRKQSSEQQISGIPIRVVNLKPGTTATTNPTTATVTLEGSRSVVEGLTVKDISVIVDLNGGGPGTYQLQPKVILPAGVQYRDTNPEKVTVTVSETPPPATPTPAPPAAESP